jgi:hypothetical protein
LQIGETAENARARLTKALNGLRKQKGRKIPFPLPSARNDELVFFNDPKKAEDIIREIRKDMERCPLLSVAFVKQLVSKDDQAREGGAFDELGFVKCGIRFLLLGTYRQVVAVDIMSLRRNALFGDIKSKKTLLLAEVLPAPLKDMLMDDNILKVGNGLSDTMGGQLQCLGLQAMRNTLDTQRLLQAAKADYSPAAEAVAHLEEFEMEDQAVWVYALEGPHQSHRPWDRAYIKRHKEEMRYVPPYRTYWIYQWQAPLTQDHKGYLFTEGQVPILVCLDLLVEIVQDSMTRTADRGVREVIMEELHRLIASCKKLKKTRPDDLMDILEAHRLVSPKAKCRARLEDFYRAAWQINEHLLLSRFPRYTFTRPDGKKVGPVGSRDEPRVPPTLATKKEMMDAYEREQMLALKQQQPPAWQAGMPASMRAGTPTPGRSARAGTPHHGEQESDGRLYSQVRELVSLLKNPPKPDKRATIRESPVRERRHSQRSDAPTGSYTYAITSSRTTERESSSSEEEKPRRHRRRRDSSSSIEIEEPRQGSSRQRSPEVRRRRSRESPLKRGRYEYYVDKEKTRKYREELQRDAVWVERMKHLRRGSPRPRPKSTPRREARAKSLRRTEAGGKKTQVQITSQQSQPRTPRGGATAAAEEVSIPDPSVFDAGEDQWRNPEVVTRFCEEMGKQAFALSQAFHEEHALELLSFSGELRFDMFCAVCAQVRCCSVICQRAARKCLYPPCRADTHDIVVCPILHGRCRTCHYRGHTAGQCKRHSRQDWFLLFEGYRTKGWYTRLADLYWNFGFFQANYEMVSQAVLLTPYSRFCRAHEYNCVSMQTYLDYLAREGKDAYGGDEDPIGGGSNDDEVEVLGE